MKNDFGVVILGAGMAGLSAAQSFWQSQFRDFVVLEARRRIGGRIHTIEVDGKPLELGAQWIHGGCPDNNVYALADKLHLIPSNSKCEETRGNTSVFASSAGRRIPDKSVRTAQGIYEDILDGAQNYFSRGLAKSEPIVPLSKYYNDQVELGMSRVLDTLDPIDQEDIRACLRALRNSLALYAGNELDQCNLQLYGSSSELPGGDIEPIGGLTAILEAIMGDIPREHIRLNSTVTSVVESEDGFTVTTLAGDEFQAQNVICTLPIGVMKSTPIFSPHLIADKKVAIRTMGAGQVAKIFLQWSSPWWQAQYQEPFDLHLVWSEEDDVRDDPGQPMAWCRQISAFHQVTGHDHMLMAWVTGHGATTADQLEEDVLKTQCVTVLRQFTGLDVPPPRQMFHQPWTRDPLTLGAYSLPLVTCTNPSVMVELAQTYRHAAGGGLFFAGEATSPQFASFIHGARESGLTAAQSCLNARATGSGPAHKTDNA